MSIFIDHGAFAAALERDRGIPVGFALGLAKSSAWECVLKTHALIEPSVNDHLMAHLFSTNISASNDEALREIVEHFRWEQRLNFLRIAEVIPVATVKFLEELNRLRGRYAHRLKATLSPLRAMYADQAAAKSAMSVLRLIQVSDPEKLLDEDNLDRLRLVLSTQVAIWQLHHAVRGETYTLPAYQTEHRPEDDGVVLKFVAIRPL